MALPRPAIHARPQALVERLGKCFPCRPEPKSQNSYVFAVDISENTPKTNNNEIANGAGFEPLTKTHDGAPLPITNLQGTHGQHLPRGLFRPFFLSLWRIFGQSQGESGHFWPCECMFMLVRRTFVKFGLGAGEG